MAAAKAKKVVLTIRKQPNTRTKRSKRKDGTKTLPIADAEPADGDAGIDHNTRGRRLDSDSDLGQEPRPSNDIDLTTAGSTGTTAELRDEVTLIRGQFRCAGSEVEDLTRRFIAALEGERMQNAELRKRLEDIASTSNSENVVIKPIPRPRGTAGTNFSIQEAMGLAGSVKKYETYKAIQVR
jgi:hypothetical protein